MTPFRRTCQVAVVATLFALVRGLGCPRGWSVERRLLVAHSPERVHHAFESESAWAGWLQSPVRLQRADVRRGVDVDRLVDGQPVAHVSIRYEEVPQGTSLVWRETGEVAGPAGGLLRGYAEQQMTLAVDRAFRRLTSFLEAH